MVVRERERERKTAAWNQLSPLLDLACMCRYMQTCFHSSAVGSEHLSNIHQLLFWVRIPAGSRIFLWMQSLNFTPAAVYIES